jgi:hypothetical protein
MAKPNSKRRRPWRYPPATRQTQLKILLRTRSRIKGSAITLPKLRLA